MKINYLKLTEWILLVSIFAMQIGNMSPEKRAEAIKVTVETLDSLGKTFVIELQKDSSIVRDTIAQPNILVDTIK